LVRIGFVARDFFGPKTRMFIKHAADPEATAHDSLLRNGPPQVRQVLPSPQVSTASTMGRRTHNGLALLDAMFKQPVVTAGLVEEMLAVSQPTASAVVRDMEKIGVLRELTGRRRYRVFAYSDYMALFPDSGSRG
jgi:hypothetical protein